MGGGVSLFFASVNFLVCDLSIGKCIDETLHTLQAAPFSFPVYYFSFHPPLINFIQSNLVKVTTSVSLTRVFGDNSPFASSSVHQTLVLIALGLPLAICSALPLTLLYFGFPHLGCLLASIFALQIPVEVSVNQTTSPSARARALASCSMDMASTKSLGHSRDVGLHTLTPGFFDDLIVVLRCSQLPREYSITVAPFFFQNKLRLFIRFA
jgi:hypothetical protein